MGWARAIVYAQSRVEETLATPLSASDVKALLQQYINTKGSNPLAMDRDEFLKFIDQPHFLKTSVATEYAVLLFQNYVNAQLETLSTQDFPEDVKVVSFNR